MISANTYYKFSCKRLFLSITVCLIVFSACGNKTNPLPPLTATPKQPDKPSVLQKGDSIVIKIGNPFAGRSDNWKLKLYRTSKMLLPAADKEKSESNDKENLGKSQSVQSDDKEAKNSVAEQPDLVVISSENTAFKKSYPELPKIDSKQFAEGSFKILEISGKAKSADYSREITYIDPKKYDAKKLHPEAFYYAVSADDPNNEIGSFSAITGIMSLPIETAPSIAEWNVDKDALKLKIIPPEIRASADNLKYFTGFNIYKGDCDTPQKTAVLAKPFEYIPVDWTIAGILRVIPLNAGDEKLNSGVGILFGGRKKQEIRQVVADEKAIPILQNAVLHLKAELRCPVVNSMKAKIQFDDGREGKLIETQIIAEKDWKLFESDFNVYHAARKLDIILSTEDSKYVSYLEVKNISLTVSKLSTEEKEKEQAKPQTADKKPAAAKKEETSKTKTILKIGDELITNGNFSEYPLTVLKDDKYSLEKDVCYSAVSTLKFDDNYYESENGTPVKIYIKDIFLPETVKGLYSLAKLDSITLIWQPSKDKDLAGYNIYRKAEQEEKYSKINTEPVRETEFTDIPPQINIKYSYYIVAVDKSLSANESKPSEIIEFIARADIKPQK